MYTEPFNSQLVFSFLFLFLYNLQAYLQMIGCMIWTEGVTEGYAVCFVFFFFFLSALLSCVTQRGTKEAGQAAAYVFPSVTARFHVRIKVITPTI